MLRIYKSSAGSGKTYTLVKEFLRIALKSPDKFKHILAITFTNKAANEMKERIISTLEQIKNDEAGAQRLISELAAESELPEAVVVDKAGKILRNILHNYSDISVSTIDSFVHRIVRAFTYDLYIPMNFEVEMDRDKILTETIELLMDRLSEEDDNVTNAIIEFAESNIEEGKSWNLEYSLVQLGKELFNEDAYMHLEKLGEFDFNEAKKVRESLHKFATAFEQKVFGEGKKAMELIANNGLTAESFFQTTKGIFGYFLKYASEEFPKDSDGNSYVKKTIFDDKWTGGKASKTDVQAIDDIKHQLVECYNNIQSLYSHQGPDFVLSKLLLRNFYSFILLADIQKLMDEYKKENNILHISEFQEKIHAIVREQEAPVIYERIGDKYDSILIDEHQDTSVLQWQNLLPLIENSQFKDEDSLVVGDGKQAIYRFRNGKVEQFAMLPKIYNSESDRILREREVAINNYGTETKNLAFNYRSRKEVVDFNNSLYDTLSGFDELKNKSIYEGQSQSQGRKADGGFVSIEFLEDGEESNLEDNRCLRVEQIVSESKARGYQLKDIAVLTRSNRNGSHIASYLIDKGIPVISSESLLINNSPKVKLILSVLGYFDRREDHIARAEIAYYIHLLLLQKEFRFELFDFKCVESIFEEQISALLGKEFRTYNFLTYQLVDLLHELMVFFGLRDDDPFLQFFLDEAMVFASRNRSNIREFLEWWDEVKFNKSIIYPETLDAVKIMTLHKSKGLQFPVVIMADADWPQKNAKRNFWVDIDKPWLKDFHVGILPVVRDVLQTEYAPLYEEEDASAFLDLLNLLYVGTTRPEDMLYILSTQVKRLPEKNNSVTALLINYLSVKGLWDGFKNYEFGDVNTVRLKKAGNGHEKGSYISERAGSALKGARQITIKRNSKLLWNDEGLETRDK
jgi:ATP-dependent exoDNAse (exonuclease V) beta subunit